MSIIKSIAVYCGSSNGDDKKFFIEAERLGKYLADENIKLVYGGGESGLMGAVSNSIVKNGGSAKGVITKHLINKEMINKNVKDMSVVESMSERKNEMFNSSDAFLIFPGGIGTLEEFFEVLSWKQLNLHSKKIFIYNLNGYWNELADLIKKIIDCKFAGSNIKDDYIVITNLKELSSYL